MSTHNPNQIQPTPPAHGSRTPGSASGTIGFERRAAEHYARTEKVWRAKICGEVDRGCAYFWGKRGGQPQGWAQ